MSFTLVLRTNWLHGGRRLAKLHQGIGLGVEFGQRILNLLCSRRCLAGKLLDLACDHRETTIRLTGPRRLDRGVQRQQRVCRAI
jgi:hypothetical protein